MPHNNFALQKVCVTLFFVVNAFWTFYLAGVIGMGDPPDFDNETKMRLFQIAYVLMAYSFVFLAAGSISTILMDAERKYLIYPIMIVTVPHLAGIIIQVLSSESLSKIHMEEFFFAFVPALFDLLIILITLNIRSRLVQEGEKTFNNKSSGID